MTVARVDRTKLRQRAVSFGVNGTTGGNGRACRPETSKPASAEFTVRVDFSSYWVGFTCMKTTVPMINARCIDREFL